MFDFSKNKSITKEEMAQLLKVKPESLDEFERSYKEILDTIPESDNLFEFNAKHASSTVKEGTIEEEIVNRIVDELISQVSIYTYDGDIESIVTGTKLLGEPVTLDEINSLDPVDRPQLTGTLLKKDIGEDSYKILLDQYHRSLTDKNKEKRRIYLGLFRQGLDILDLDPITYQIVGCNKNTMGYWFPKLVTAIGNDSFFKLPKTKIMKVPLSLLQLTRTDYEKLTNTTLEIVDRFCKKAFELDNGKDYFIKTGTYSSKFDFRNAHVEKGDEVNDIGEYLLFIHFQALQMASPLNNHPIYGVSTTNEWVVREFIEDVEDNPCIYKGMPLHTEYRVFVDFDDDRILGISPYWEPNIMKSRFTKFEDSDSPHNKHDYITYSLHEETLMKRYDDNKGEVLSEIERILPSIDLEGQWSIDIMQNGEDFYIIDMALAQNSALKECVDEELKPAEEIYLPDLSKFMLEG